MTGLRERKKRATREALMSAALRLVLERGLDTWPAPTCPTRCPPRRTRSSAAS
ncbi:hypothetical protein [Nonomuraea phyllanthi]|uniref:hypothetical protein n=1 Tax=Nonomuraea phyllanthi TaxID=2219224 RepID=UPI0021D59426|nr:hypothetical protein [Nonomuraea phyllanthi]